MTVTAKDLVTAHWILMSSPLQHLYLALRTIQWGRHNAPHFTSEGLRLVEGKDLPQVTQLVGSRRGICTGAAGYLCAGLADGYTGAVQLSSLVQKLSLDALVNPGTVDLAFGVSSLDSPQELA